MNLRPLPARQLKSAIDTLRPWIPESDVLELYCGRGDFGVRCLQEGAHTVTWVDTDRKAFRGQHLTCLDAFTFLKQVQKKQIRFDIVLADPPYSDWNSGFLKFLFNAVTGVLKANAIFLVKHPKRVIASPIERLTIWKHNLCGDSQLTFFKTTTT